MPKQKKPRDRAESLVIAENLNIGINKALSVAPCSNESIKRLDELKKHSERYYKERRISKVNLNRLLNRIKANSYYCYGRT